MTTPREGGTLKLLSWAMRPRTAGELFRILAATRDDELMALLQRKNVGSRIAWAELGRRRFGVVFGVESYVREPVVFPPAFELPS